MFQFGNALLYQELLDPQFTQPCYFSDMSKSSVIIFQTLSFFMSSWFTIIQSTHNHHTCLTNSMLISVLLIEGLLLLESSFTFLFSSWNLLCHLKMSAQRGVISHSLFEAFQVLVRIFPNWTESFKLYLFLGIDSWMTWKRGVNKSMCIFKKKKRNSKIQWLQEDYNYMLPIYVWW